MRQTLSVRSKIILAVVVSVVALSVAIYLISTQVLLKSYLAIEREAMADNIRRGTDAVNEFSNQQMIKLSDWAQWDEAYDYAISRDQEWIDSTTYPSGLANLDINLSMYSDTEGEVFYLLVADIEERSELSSTTVSGFFRQHKDLIKHPGLTDATQGLVLLPDGPMVLVSLPLRTSEGKGPIPGSITFGRYLDKEKIKDFADVTHLDLSIFSYEETELPADVAQAKANLSKEENEYIAPLSSDRIAGYSILYDLFGAPMLILKVETARPIYAQGNSTLAAYLGIGAFALLVFGLIILFLIERFVTARFFALSKAVDTINVKRDLSIKLAEDVQDEIGKLAGNINTMLAWLTQAREAEASSRREIVNLLDELKKGKEQEEEMRKILENKKPGL